MEYKIFISIILLISFYLIIKFLRVMIKEANDEFNNKYFIPKIANIKNGEHYQVYIGRENKWLNLERSIWANPFPFKLEKDREESLIKYENYLRTNTYLISKLKSLSGMTLGCYCHPKHCHGDIIIKIFKEKVLN